MMVYKYKKLEIILEEDEVYMLWDIISFAIDYHCTKPCLSDEKLAFAEKLQEITNEMR